MRRTCQPFSFSAAVSFSSDCQPSLAPESQVARPVAPAALLSPSGGGWASPPAGRPSGPPGPGAGGRGPPAAPAIRLSAPPMHSLSFTQSSRLFLGIERMAAHDGFLALGPGRDEVDRYPGELLDALQVRARRRRQRVVRLDADGALHPARQLLVHRVAALELLGAHRQDLGEGALELVADADLHRLDAVEHIELGDAQAGDAVQLDRALEGRGIEPAGASRPPGGGAEFLAALPQPPPTPFRDPAP